MVGVRVSQRQGLLYRCSSTAGDQFPLSAGRFLGRVVLPMPSGPVAAWRRVGSRGEASVGRMATAKDTVREYKG